MGYCNYLNTYGGCYTYYPSYSYCGRSCCPPQTCLKVEVINLTGVSLQHFQLSEHDCDTTVGQSVCVPANGSNHLNVLINCCKKYDFSWKPGGEPTSCGEAVTVTCYYAQNVTETNCLGSQIEIMCNGGSAGQSHCYQWFSTRTGNCLTIYVYPAPQSSGCC